MTDQIAFDFTYFRARGAIAATLKALGVGDRSDDCVALQAYTCIAVPEAILAAGARPQFVDVEPDGVTMAPKSLAARITSETRAIIVQHTFGIPADMDAIMRIASDHSLPVIEDCAHTYWSEVGGARCGTFGVAATYSLEWGKPLVLGVGGGLVLNEERLREELAAHHAQLEAPSQLRNARMQLQYAAFKSTYHPRSYWRIKALYGRLSNAGVAERSFNSVDAGISDDFKLQLSRPVARRAARKLPEFRPDWERQAGLLAAYRRGLSSHSELRELSPQTPSKVMYGRWPLWADDKEAILHRAQEQGFEVSDWFASAVDPLSEREFSAVNYEPGSCPNAEEAAAHIVSLPMNARVSVTSAERATRALTGSPSVGQTSQRQHPEVV